LLLNLFILVFVLIILKYIVSSSKNNRKRNKIYNLSKYIIWVVRISQDETPKLKDAMPCHNCCKSLYKLGFRKICFSNNNGNIEIIDLRYFQNNHLSYAQKNSEKYCRKIL
jgi:hypothetical protein